MGKKEDHHIIPQALLKKFTNSEGKLYRLNARETRAKNIRSFYPAGVGYEKNFYELKDSTIQIYPTNEDPLYIENTVNQFYENNLHRYWKMLEGNFEKITIEEKQIISEIIIHLRLRNKSIRNRVFDPEGLEKLIENFKTDVSENIVDGSETFKLYNSLLKSSDFLDEFIKVAFIERDPSDVHNQFLANSFTENHTDFKVNILNKYLNSHWTILTANENDYFVLGDNPGLMKNENGILPFTGPFEFIFPINSKRYLHMQYKGHDLQDESMTKISYFNLPTVEVKKVNTQAACDSVAFIYAANDDILKTTREDFMKFMKTIDK